jgi:hypothetical protein
MSLNSKLEDELSQGEVDALNASIATLKGVLCSLTSDHAMATNYYLLQNNSIR